jgi:signal transduction histidine kinase
MERLVIISGASDMDRLFGELALTASRRYEQRIAVRHFSGMPLAEMLAAVEALPDRSAILLTAYHMSAAGTAYYTREVTQEVAARAKVPVYVLFDSNVDVGGVGGYVISFKKVGFEAGRIALRILRGEDPAAIPPVREGLLQYQFDWRQLRRFGIPEDRLPEGSVILHRETTFFERYFWIVMGAIIFFTVQSTLIAYLIILNRRQNTLSERVRRAESRYRELLRIERSTRLGELAGSLAHELNQPLAAILSSAQAALRFLKSEHTEPEVFRKILNQIVADDKRAASIIRSMRAMLKKVPADSELLEINDLLAEVVTIFHGEAVNRRIRIETELDRGPLGVMASKTQFLQVLLNLMINAAQAMASNRGDDRRLVLATRNKGHHVIVSVRDVGPGIEPDHLDKLFEPLFTTRSKGMGMGLAVCRGIVEDLGGSIRAGNNPDRGAVFTIQLPAVNNE